MKNKFKYGELVIAKGRGKISNKEFECLALVECKEYYYNEYLLNLLSSGSKDWFREKDIKRVLERKNKKMNKYKVVLAIDKRGLEIINRKLEKINDNKNNKLLKTDFYKEYKVKSKEYAILVWTSTYWAVTNNSAACIQQTLPELRKLDIAYKQIIIGETDITYVRINEFIDNDNNVDIFDIIPKIRINNVGGILV